MSFTNQTLIFDADDTLWECYKYFEESISEFVSFLHDEHLTPEEIRVVLDDFERANGYGARAFSTSLVETYRHFATENDPGDEQRIQELGIRILEQEMETIPGVAETLAKLQPHHRLLLFTKGDDEEQRLKIARSEVSHFFELHIVTHDKTIGTYKEIVESLNLADADTWMIGNSLRSDIQPALAAGLHAIYIPNPHTWHFEHLDFEHHPDWQGRMMEVTTFAELTTLFHH